MTRFLSLSLLALLSAFDPVKCHLPTSSPAPTETAIPSPSPSGMPTVSSEPTITSQPTVTASTSPTITPVPTDSPTESPAPSPSPSEAPTNVPSVSPSMVPTSRPSYNPSSIPSDLPSLAPSKNPTAAPTSKPSSNPTLSQQPSSPPTNFPTVSSKKHTALVNFILGGVPGAMPEQQQVTFTTVAKEVIQNSLDTADDVSIEILYVQVKNQQFFPTASTGSNRRALQDEVEDEFVGVLEIEMEVAAAITPGDYSGFQEMLEGLILDPSTDILIDDALKRNEAFFDYEPLMLSSQPAKDPSDEGTFSNGAMFGIAASCVVGVGLFFHQARRTQVRVAGRRMKTASFTDESDEDDNHHTKDDFSNGEDPSGAFDGRSSYVPKEWDATSPQSIGDDTKFTTFSTNAVLNGKSNKKSSSLIKSMLRLGDNATSNLTILHDLESPEIEIAETRSDLVEMATCGCAAPKRERSDLILPQVREESSAYGGSQQAEDMTDEMTAIETILE